MFNYPYDTTAGSAYVLKDIVSALQHAAIDGQLLTAHTGKNIPIEGLFEVPPYLKSVGQFAHPLAFERGGKTQIAIDTRPFTRLDRDGHTVHTSAPSDRAFAILRGRLTQAWTQHRYADMAVLGDIAPTVFFRLLSEGIVRRLGLSPMDQQGLVVLACYFYFGQFEQRTELTERDVLKFAQRISRLSAINVERVLQVLDGLIVETDDGPKTYPVLQNLDAFVKACQKTSSNPRMQTLNTGLLMASVVGGWYGPAAREVMAIGLEYPPIWIALVYTALQDRSFNGAQFTKLVQQCDKRDMGKQFAFNVAAFLEVTAHEFS